MKYDTLKNKLTQTRIQLKSAERVIRELQLKNKKLQDVLIKINGLSMRTISDETQRLDKT